MDIAIIGSGVSGLVSAFLLNKDHRITVFEASDRIGGHSHTVSVARGSRTFQVDTGFVVFNEAAYPNFTKLLGLLAVESQLSDMSFSVQCESTGLEYASSSLGAMFAQRRNLFRPAFYRMLLDIRRFFRESREVLNGGRTGLTLGEYIRDRGYSRAFIEQHIIPMGSAIWSAAPRRFERFPIEHFVRFFDNHGFLSVAGRSVWRTVCGGSRHYVEALTASFRNRIRTNAPIAGVRRLADGVEVESADGQRSEFDRVVIATHSDQALAILRDASEDERRVLGAIPYQANDTVLHTDHRLLPRRRKAWASWNYFRPRDRKKNVQITYCMNKLQSLDTDDAFCVSLNRTSLIDERRVIRSMAYEHPIHTSESFAAQADHERINGVNNTYFCGAYWGYGFHEDGVRSALAVCRHFGLAL